MSPNRQEKGRLWQTIRSSDRRRETVRAAEQGLQGAGTDHRSLGTLPHGHGQSGRSQRHPGQRQGRGDARNGTRGDRGTGTEDRNPRRGDQTPVDSQGPAGCEKRDRRDPRRHGRRRSRHLRRRPDAHVHQIHRIQRLEVRNHLLLGRHGRRIQGGRDESHGQQCLWYAQIRIGRTSRAARTPDRNAGPRPHLGRFGGRAARSRGVRRRNLDERHPQGYLLRFGPRRTVGQYDLLGDPPDAHPDRYRRAVPGPEIAAQELRQGFRRTSHPRLQPRIFEIPRRNRLEAQDDGLDGRPFGQDPHLQLSSGAHHRPPR